MLVVEVSLFLSLVILRGRMVHSIALECTPVTLQHTRDLLL